MILTLTVPCSTQADINYLERLSLFCNQQGIQLLIGQNPGYAALRFMGNNKVMADLKNYLEQRSG